MEFGAVPGNPRGLQFRRFIFTGAEFRAFFPFQCQKALSCFGAQETSLAPFENCGPKGKHHWGATRESKPLILAFWGQKTPRSFLEANTHKGLTGPLYFTGGGDTIYIPSERERPRHVLQEKHPCPRRNASHQSGARRATILVWGNTQDRVNTRGTERTILQRSGSNPTINRKEWGETVLQKKRGGTATRSNCGDTSRPRTL